MSLFERDCHICWGFFCLCWYYMHIYQRFPWNVLIASFQIFTKISFGHHFIYIIFWIDHCYASILYSCKLRSLEYFFFVYQLWMQCSLNLFTTMFMNAWILFLTFKFWFDHDLHVHVYGSLFILLTFCDYKLGLIHYMIKLFIHYGLHLIHYFYVHFLLNYIKDCWKGWIFYDYFFHLQRSSNFFRQWLLPSYKSFEITINSFFNYSLKKE